MNFELAAIMRLIEVIEDNPEYNTGDPWLEKRYKEDIPIIGHVNPYYKLFNQIAKYCQPRLTVELGSYWGTAAAHFASGWLDGFVITMDIHKDDQRAQRKTREARDHYNNFSYLNRWTWDAAPMLGRLLQSTGGSIDILYIDAWHEYQYANRERELFFPLLSDPALVICDDIFDAEGATVDMVRFWKEMRGEKFLNKTLHLPAIPMGFMKYEKRNYP